MLHRVDSPICPPKKQQSSSITLWLLIIVDKAWKTNQAEFFSFDMFTLQNLAKNFGACKPTFHTFYTSHLRWNSTTRPCFYHTDLGQNAVFHNFAIIQIAPIQYSGRSKQAWAFSETVKKISKITYSASRLSLLTSANVDYLN